MSERQTQYDFCERGHFTTNADPGDEARMVTRGRVIDATLPARLLGPVGDVEAAVQRGMGIVRGILDGQEAAELARLRERERQWHGEIVAFEAERARACDEARREYHRAEAAEEQARNARGMADEFERQWQAAARRADAAQARVAALEAERARLRAALEPLAALADAGEAWLGPVARDDTPLDLQAICHVRFEVRAEPVTLGHARAARAALDAGEGRDG